MLNFSFEHIEESEIFDLLTLLVDRSLVLYDESSGRYRLLESVRQYSRERLVGAGERESVFERHLDHYLAFAAGAELQLKGSEQQVWLDRLEAEHDNLRSALLGTGDRQMLLAASLWRFWLMRGHVSEGRRRLDLLVGGNKTQRPSLALAAAHNGAAGLAFIQSEFQAARNLYAKAAALRHELGDRIGEAGSLCNLATVAQAQGDIEFARRQFEHSMPIFQEEGDDYAVATNLVCLGTVAYAQGDTISALEYLNRAIVLNREIGNRASEANALNNLGTVHRESHDFTAARETFEAALNINREVGYWWEASLNLINLGQCAVDEGDCGAARTFLTEAIEKLRPIDARRDMVSWVEAWASLEVCLGRKLRAARLTGFVSAHRESLAVPPNTTLQIDPELTLEALMSPECEPGLAREFQFGLAMTLDLVIEFALLEPCDG